jgi:hypothetical protein
MKEELAERTYGEGIGFAAALFSEYQETVRSHLEPLSRVRRLEWLRNDYEVSETIVSRMPGFLSQKGTTLNTMVHDSQEQEMQNIAFRRWFDLYQKIQFKYNGFLQDLGKHDEYVGREDMGTAEQTFLRNKKKLSFGQANPYEYLQDLFCFLVHRVVIAFREFNFLKMNYTRNLIAAQEIQISGKGQNSKLTREQKEKLYQQCLTPFDFGDYEGQRCFDPQTTTLENFIATLTPDPLPEATFIPIKWLLKQRKKGHNQTSFYAFMAAAQIERVDNDAVKCCFVDFEGKPFELSGRSKQGNYEFFLEFFEKAFSD